MSGSFYFRGFRLEADTFNVAKSLAIRDADTGSLHPYVGGPAQSQIKHNGQSQIEYSFVSPFVSHLIRDEPQDQVQWRRFGLEWIGEPCPDLTVAPTKFVDCGTTGAKYMLAIVIPVDTAGQACSFTASCPDGGATTIDPFTTTADQKTPVAMPFVTPFVAHELQLKPSVPCRIWIDEAKWIYDPWPEFISEASAWFNCGNAKPKACLGFTIPLDTGGVPVVLKLISSDGGSITLPAVTTPLNVKTPTPFAFTVPLIGHEFQIIPQSPCRCWWDEIDWRSELWPERTAESSPWLNCGTPGAKYMRKMTIPLDTGSAPITLTLRTSLEAQALTFGPFTTTADLKTPTPIAFIVPAVAHELQITPSGPCRCWWSEIQWEYDPWPEMITEATGWLTVLPGGLAAFLQGLVAPLEAVGAAPVLTLLTDNGATVALTSTVTPAAFVKTSCPFSLATPVIAHQVQLVLLSGACRIWDKEIVWVAQPTPELASTWKTQATAHGLKGYQSIVRIEAAYASTAAVTLSFSVTDGIAPTTITLPSTAGAYSKVLLTLTANKFQSITYSAVTTGLLQMFVNDWTIWISQWGRDGGSIPYQNLGSAHGDKAGI